jgi:hypothetical protein
VSLSPTTACSTQAGYRTGRNILIDGGVFPAAF